MRMDEPTIIERFEAWTKGLNPREARISIFTHIRDIPYYLVPQIDDPRRWAGSILKNNKGSCSPKHYLLGLLFEKLGIKISYVTYPFRWSGQGIKYPPELKKLAAGSPIGYHVACKAYLKNRWVLVDATWDTALKKRGFPINDGWDGVSDTLNAVIPLEELVHKTLDERLTYVAGKKALWTPEERASYAKFIEEFNRWAETLRDK